MYQFDDAGEIEVNDPDFLAALDQLGRGTQRLTTSVYDLVRNLSIRGHEREQGATKGRRLPSVRKTSSAPGDGAALLAEATAARKAGPLAWDRWCERKRQETALAAV